MPAPKKEFCTRGHTLAETRGFHGCRECIKVRSRVYYLRTCDRERPVWRDRSLKLRYGLSSAEYGVMLEQQDGRCAICGTVNFGVRSGKPASAFVDHEHETGKIRGLLCGSCNTGLGAFGDSPELLLEARAYLVAVA